MKEEELIKVRGGSLFNASLINAVTRGAEFVYKIGRSLGSTFKMLITGRKC